MAMVSEGDCRVFFLFLRDLLEQRRNLRQLRNWLAWEKRHEFAKIIRNLEGLPVEDLFEIRRALSIGQMESKLWLIDIMRGLVAADRPLSVCVVGGWCGTLPLLIHLLKPFPLLSITQIDLSPTANAIAKSINRVSEDQPEFFTVTGNALAYNYQRFDVIINTSCEHFNPNDLEQWVGGLPTTRYLFLQSNNFTEEPGHVNCHNSVFAFRKSLPLKTCLFTGELQLERYTRHMVAGITNYNQ